MPEKEDAVGKPHEERKEEIIKKTLELAADEGVARLTTQAIADRVGIAQSTIFKHFKTRDAILNGAIKWISGQIFQLLQITAGESASASVRLHSLISRQLALVGKHRGLPRLLFSDRLHLESPQLKKTVSQVMLGYMDRVSSLIKEGMEEGLFRKDCDPDERARCIVALIQGLVVRWSLFDFSFSLEDEGEAVWRFVEASLIQNSES